MSFHGTMRYADDLVISAETEFQSIEKFNSWNEALQKRSLKINVDKTKHLTSGQKCIPQKIGIFMGLLFNGSRRQFNTLQVFVTNGCIKNEVV